MCLKNKFYFLFLFLIVYTTSYSQCPTPELYDGTFTPGTNPTWLNCINLAGSPDTFQVNFGSPDDIANYSIDFGDGSPIVTGASLLAGNFISHTYMTLGIFTVTFTETENGCPVTITGTVVNERTPTAGINGPSAGLNSGCAPHEVCFGNNSFNVTPSTIFEWDFGDGTTETFGDTNAMQTVCHTFPRVAADCGIVISLTATNNCGASTATWNPVNIFDIDDAEVTPDNDLLCYPDTTVTFTNTSTLNCISGTRLIYWDFGDGTTFGWTSINTPMTHSFPGLGTYTVMMVDSNACGADTAYSTIRIVPQPTASVRELEDTICQNNSITFENNSTGGANEFVWNFGDGTIITVNNTNDQTHTYTTSGSFVVSLTANINNGTSNCTSTDTTSIFVRQGPTSNFTIDNNEACDSLTVNITESALRTVSWQWDFGNGDTSSLQNPPSPFYNSEDSFYISLLTTSSNGCTSSSERLVVIHDSPTAYFGVERACIGDTASFLDSSSFSTDSITAWNWNFGDGGTSMLQNPNHVYNNGGTINVTLTVNTANCSDNITRTIRIDSLPLSRFTPDVFNGCTDLSVSFTNNSLGAVNYYWEVDSVFSSGATNYVDTFSNTSLFMDSTYTVRLIAETAFGCLHDTSMDITVYPLPIANFSSDASPQCSPLEVQFTNASINYASSSWDFGDGTTSNGVSPNHTFINDTIFIETFTTQLAVESIHGCRDTIDEVITVYPKPEFDFVGDSGCSELTTTFSANSGAVIYQWDFDDGGIATGQNVNHTFVNTTLSDIIYDVQLIATSPFGCPDTSHQDVLVYSLPQAQFSITPISQVFPNSTIQLTNTSQNATTYNWDFGDSTFTTGNPASHTYDDHGNYTVTLVAQNTFCTDTFSMGAIVIPAVPVSDFNISAEGCRPLTVTMENTSLYADSYYWDFGDGGNSTQENPTYTYYNAGTYTVSLIAKGAGGETTYQKKDVIIVHELPGAAFTANNKIVHLPNEIVNFYNLSTNADSYYWDFGDGNTSTEKFPEYLYSQLGEFKVTLVANNNFGCTDTTFDFITTIAGGQVVIPNAFTPNPLGGNGGNINAEGLNDVFYPITEGVTKFNMKVFNRWGELLFESNDYQIGWDGYYKGKICKQDVYVYKLTLEFQNGATVEKVGDITLLR